MKIMFFENTTSINEIIKKHAGQWALVCEKAGTITAKFADGAQFTTSEIVSKLGDINSRMLDIVTASGTNYRFEAPSMWDFEKGRPAVPNTLLVAASR